MARFPFGTGKGWYMVAYSDELGPGASLSLRRFGRALTLTRGADGQPRLTDDGDQVDGAWTVREAAGVVCAWYPDGAAPAFDLPAVPEWGDPAWAGAWWKLRHVVRSHPQEMRENAIDWPHFRVVHGGSDGPEERRAEFVGPRMRFSILGVPARPGGPPTFSVTSDVVGLGLGVTRLQVGFDAINLTALTPLDDGTTEMHSAFLLRADALADPTAAARLRAMVEAHARGVEQDIPIWEHKRYRPEPVLCDGDGPILAFRRWAAQFYAL
jgi:hypothetical protein